MSSLISGKIFATKIIPDHGSRRFESRSRTATASMRKFFSRAGPGHFIHLPMPLFRGLAFAPDNLWLHEFCSYDPKRLIGVPLLSVLDVETAVQDLNEYAKMGFKGVQLPSGFKEGVYYDPIYEPIWSAAEDSNMLMIIHSGALQGGGSRKWFEKLNSADDWPGFFQHSRQTAVKTVIGQMIFSGVFDRHPSLKVVCTEFDAGWLGVIVQQVDYHYGPKKAAHGTDVQLKVKLPPSEYFKRNLWFTFMDDRAAVLTTPIYGEEQFPLVERLPSRGLHVALLAANRRSDVRRRERDGEKETISGQRQQTLRSGSLERIGSEHKEKNMARVVHLAMKVDDIDKASAFLCNVFGFKQITVPGVRSTRSLCNRWNRSCRHQSIGGQKRAAQ